MLGYAVLPIVPSVRGVGGSVARQLAQPLAAEGDRAGRSAGAAIASGIGTALKTTGVAVAAAGVAGIGYTLTKGFQRLSAIDTARAKLRGLGNDGTTVDGIMQNALASVKGTAFGLDVAATTAAGAVAAGIQPGVQLEGVLKSVANSAAAAGIGMDEMGGIYNKVASVGKAQNDSLQQVAQRGIPIYQALASQLGVTSDEVFKMASEGKISFAQFEAAMTQASGTVASEMGGTISGSVDNLTASIGRVGANLLGGLFPKIAPAVQAVTTALEPIEGQAAGIGEAIGNYLGPWIDRFTVWVSELDPAKVQSFFSSFQLPTGSQPLGAAFDSISASITTLKPAFAEFGTILPAVGEATATLAASGLTVLTGVLGFLADNVETIVAWMPAIVAGFFAWRIAGAATAAASHSLRMGELAATPIYFANNVMRLRSVTIERQLAIAKGINVGTSNAAAAATMRETVALGVKTTALNVSTAATRVAAAGQWLLNAALSANPIGIIIVVIAALVAAIIWVATQTTWFQDIWAGFTSIVGAAATWLWENAIGPVVEAIGTAWTWLYDNVIYPLQYGFWLTFGIIAGIITWIWETVFAPVLAWIGEKFLWLWNVVISVVVAYIQAYIQVLGTVINWLWTNVVSPVFNFIGAIFTWIWNSIIMPIVNFIVAYIQMWATIILWLWNNAIQPALQGVGAAFQWVWNSIIRPVIDWIVGAINNVGSVVGSVFGGIGDFIGNAFQSALDLARGPVNGLIALVNSAIRGLNTLSVTIPDWVPEVGGTTWGLNIPEIPRLAMGADITPRAGGTLAILGEAGRAETVTDLGRTNRLIELSSVLAQRALTSKRGEGGGRQVNFYGNVGWDPDELFDEWDRRDRVEAMLAGVGTADFEGI